MDKLKILVNKIYYILLGYLPFHALITTLLISTFGFELLFKGAKDALSFVLLAVASFIVIARIKTFNVKQLKIFSFIVTLFIVLVLTISLTNRQEPMQTIAGIVFIFRPFWIFFAGVLATSFVIDKNYESKLLKILMTTSLVVIIFGALQVLVLPKDFLANFGYSVSTIMPYQTIDNNESFARILSTLRGPNPLGAYLAMLAPMAIYFVSKIKKHKNTKIIIYGLLFLITIYGSQSRSAWVGLVVGVGVFGLLISKNKMRVLSYSAALVPLIAAGYLFRNTNLAQTLIFHTDPAESSEVNSDDKRIETLKYAVESVNDKPFGHGIGSSGQASNYGSNSVIIENQYFDIAYQLGWIGLILYVGIIGYVGYLLLASKRAINYAHFSGLIAVSVIALFWPVWAEDTVALLWWGVAGALLSSDIVQKNKKK